MKESILQITFGAGDKLITAIGDTEERHILIEKGGEQQVGRIDEIERYMTDADLKSGLCTLTFQNPDSLGVFLRATLQSLLAFERYGRKISNENLQNELDRLCAEFCKFDILLQPEGVTHDFQESQDR